MTVTRPVTVLIAALGGEGGGVLANWIVGAAESIGLPVQSTSIPGVAQRTGATTYYIEILPVPWRELGGRRPVLALLPGIGDIDVVLASELMEAGRAVAAGFVTPDRTTTIASTSRFYVMNEKIAMGDGRYDSDRLIQAIAEQSQQHIALDMEEIACRTGTFINAVMLGVLAGCKRLPIPVVAFEGAILADGKAVESNLSGFRAGLDALRQVTGESAAVASGKRRLAMPSVADLELDIASMPAPARDVMREGVRRLAAYQHTAYAKHYLNRLAAIAEADAFHAADGRLLAAAARHLAVRMSYEDVIRVAQAKIEPGRHARIAAEMKIKPGEPLTVMEFLKPGIEEMCSILPPWLARAILTRAERRGWLGRAYWGMEVNTASISGYLRFLMLAKLRRWRPYSYRFQEEQREIEAWLGLVADAARLAPELALEIAECARLIKGYGDTHKRGTANYRLIETSVIRPALAGQMPVRQAIDAIASARTAALVDPDGEGLAKCLGELEHYTERRIAAE